MSSGTSNFDFMSVFGIDAALDARLDRAMALADELERTVNALEEDAKQACRIVATDLGGTPNDVEHPCDTLVARVNTLRASLGSGGFAVSISSVSCGVSLAGVEACAGECLTGLTGVTSAVSCNAPPGSVQVDARVAPQLDAQIDPKCALDFALPYASSCAAQCGARALREVRCSADVDVRIGNGEHTPAEYVAMVENLRRDLPKLAGLAASVGPRAAHLAAEVSKLIDEIASSIDALSDVGKSAERRAVAGAVLATCIGPRLADVIRTGATLESTLTGALQAHAALLGG